MPELVGFQTMVILDPNGMTFDAVGAFGLAFQLLLKSGSSYFANAPKFICPICLPKPKNWNFNLASVVRVFNQFLGTRAEIEEFLSDF